MEIKLCNSNTDTDVLTELHTYLQEASAIQCFPTRLLSIVQQGQI